MAGDRRRRAVRARTSPTCFRVRACAKVNLTLRVLGRRADGYHDLRTAFQVIEIGRAHV